MNTWKKIINNIIDGKKNNQISNSSISEYNNVRSSRPLSRMVQNFVVIWLDGNIDEVIDQDCRNTTTKLREVVNTVTTFTDIDECTDFITSIEEGKAFIICSGILGQTLVPVVHNMAQVSTVYIFCENKALHEQWANQWPIVNGVFTDITPICEALKQATHECDQNTIPMSFVTTGSDLTNKNLNELNHSFMYTQILKEILLKIDFKQENFKEFITYCRGQFDCNTRESKDVDKLEKEYRRHKPIWWYTYNCFLYSMLNKALRNLEVDLIIQLGFFIRDLHQHIAQLHSEQYGGHHLSNSFIVYRGQYFSQTNFDQLKKTKGGLLSFNCFLSTSKSRDVSLKFVPRAKSDLVSILFVMTIDPSVHLTPFADVHDDGCFEKEEEILFSMHSIFRIEQIKQIDENNRLWQVDLLLTSDHDPQLHALTERIREETFPNEKGWYRLGYLLIKLGQFDKAQQVCEVMLTQKSNNRERSSIYHMLGIVKYHQGEYEEATINHEKTDKVLQKILPLNNSDLATSYACLGYMHEKMGDYSKALLLHEKALKIYQNTHPPNHSHIALSFNNIGMVYDNMGEYSTALLCHEKALEIYEKNLPHNHPDLATSYDKFGKVLSMMGEYSKALSSYKKALEIRKKTPNHSHLAVSYNNIGGLYDKMNDYLEALTYYERALDIEQRSPAANQYHLRIYKKNVESVTNKTEMIFIRL